MTTRSAAAKLSKISIQEEADKRGFENPKSISKRELCTLINIVPKKDAVRLDDFFTLDKLLGKGNFGQVWLAKDKKTGAEYALKLLENMTEDSQREVGVLSVLAKGCKADNILCYYDNFRATTSLNRKKEILYYVIQTEFIKGIEMHKWRDEWFIENSKAPPKETLHRLAKSLLNALVYIHKHRVYHLDVKPSNIIIQDSNGECKLIDFGLACSQASKDSCTTCFQTDGFGTPGYMSPDYASNCLLNFQLGLCNEETRRLTDIWAFGLTILSLLQVQDVGEEFQQTYEQTVLKNDFKKEDEEAFLRLISSPKSLPKFKTDAVLTSIIKSALTVDPAQRPSAADLMKMFK